MKSTLVYCLNFFAVLSFIAMFVMACCYIAWPYEFDATKSHHSDPNFAVVVGYVLTGIFSSLFLFTLARVVEACDKYLKNK